MAYNTTNMSLRVWNLLTDHFSHTDLEANWVAIDGHDHSTSGVQIPTGGIATAAVTNAKLSDDSVDTRVLAPNAVTPTELANNAVTTGKVLDAQITKSKLATDALNTFLKLNIAGDRKVAFGTAFTGSFGGGRHYHGVVSHGLGVSPSWVFMTMGSIATFSGTGTESAVAVSWAAPDHTTIDFAANIVDGLSNNAATLYWMAVV